MKPTETADALMAAVQAFLAGPGNKEVPPVNIETAIRYAEHRLWMEEAQARLEVRKSELVATDANLEMLLEWHIERIETERRRHAAADAEARYWHERARLLGRDG
jgi:hypothetical protein